MAVHAAKSIQTSTTIMYGAPRVHLRSFLRHVHLQPLCRRLLGGKGAADCPLFREGCKMTEPVQGDSPADSQLRSDEEGSLEVNGGAIIKLYNDPACENVNSWDRLNFWPLAPGLDPPGSGPRRHP